MKIGVVVVMFVLISSMALGYCNETVDFRDSQNYSVVRTCTADYNNQSFLYTGLILLGLLALIGAGVLFIEDGLFKAILLIPLNVILIVMLHVGTLFMKATNPEMSAVVTVMDQVFIGVVLLMIPIIVLLFCYVVYQLVIRFFTPKNKRDKEWDQWLEQK